MEAHEAQSGVRQIARCGPSIWPADDTTVQTQIQEMQHVRDKVYAMEQQHMTLKQK